MCKGLFSSLSFSHFQLISDYLNPIARSPETICHVLQGRAEKLDFMVYFFSMRVMFFVAISGLDVSEPLLSLGSIKALTDTEMHCIAVHILIHSDGLCLSTILLR